MTRRRISVALVVLVLLGGCSGSAAPAETTAPISLLTNIFDGGGTVDDSVLMWSSFVCATYTGFTEMPQEGERLSQLGLESGKRFLEALDDQQFSPEEIDETVPMVVLGLLPGPTLDFVLGRIYQAAQTSTYERLFQEDDFGLPKPIEEWILDDDLKGIIARNEYQRNNCSLLK